MNSYLTVYRNITAERGDVLVATVLKVGASVEWAKKNANKIAARLSKHDQMPPICAMLVSEQPPEGMESAA